MLRYFLFLSLLVVVALPTAAQDTTDYVSDNRMVVVILNDGSQKMGFFVSDDGREVIIETSNLGQIAIPKYQIKEIREINEALRGQEEAWAQEPFQNRYFFSFNGLPRRTKKNYLKLYPLGLDAQFGIGENFQVGGITTWIGAPIIATAQGRFDLGKNVHGALGTYIGTNSWFALAADSPFFFALPYGSVTLGNHSSNVMVGYGYGYGATNGTSGGTSLIMVGGTTPIGSKASFVFESIFTVIQGTTGGIISPGVRWYNKPGQAFQFGFAAAFADGVFVPLPAVSWYKTLD